MVDMFAHELDNYLIKWQDLVASATQSEILKSYVPTAIGWKVEDIAEFNSICEGLRDQSEQVHYGWINERWLATFYLKQPLQPGNIWVVKIMQRRPGSQDSIGLDHVDFLVSSLEQTANFLKNEPTIKWAEENNGTHCKWLSVRFAGTEAKLRADTVLQVCADEMLEFQQKLLQEKQ